MIMHGVVDPKHMCPVPVQVDISNPYIYIYIYVLKGREFIMIFFCCLVVFLFLDNKKEKIINIIVAFLVHHYN